MRSLPARPSGAGGRDDRALRGFGGFRGEKMGGCAAHLFPSITQYTPAYCHLIPK